MSEAATGSHQRAARSCRRHVQSETGRYEWTMSVIKKPINLRCGHVYVACWAVCRYTRVSYAAYLKYAASVDDDTGIHGRVWDAYAAVSESWHLTNDQTDGQMKRSTRTTCHSNTIFFFACVLSTAVSDASGFFFIILSLVVFLSFFFWCHRQCVNESEEGRGRERTHGNIIQL